MNKDMLHHFKDFIVTIIPTASGTLAALELTNIGLKLAFAIGSLVWLYYRIAIIKIEHNKKIKEK